MRRWIATLSVAVPLAGIMLLGVLCSGASAMIQGVEGGTYNLNAKAGYVSTADGGSIYFWGYALDNGIPQYPGPTLIVNEGDVVTVNLTSELPVPVSIVFPGQNAVDASGGAQGFLAREVRRAGDTVTYTFTASKPGTYIYHSGSNPALQVDMGLVGAIVVRPAMGMGHAYNSADTAYDYETLFLLSEMDGEIHFLAEQGRFNEIDTSKYWPTYWFINGRTAPDTMLPDFAQWLPTQPYGCMPRMTPGSRLLMRVANVGQDPHPFHHHGNHARVIARYAELLESAPGQGADLAEEVFTIQAVAGGTVDAIFTWTGKGLNWDIYGTGTGFEHDCVDAAPVDGYDDVTYEWCADHGKGFPVTLPQDLSLTFGGFYSGSPYLGMMGSLPPGEGGMNPNAGFVYMWHSHTEKEMTNYDIFPGGLMTMLIIEPPGTPIEP